MNMKTQFKHLNLLGWLVIIFTVFLFGLLAFTLNKTEPEPIKPYQVDTVCTEECGWCAVVKAYSLNVTCVHYGDSVR
jgi:hypothetical protein